MGDSLVEDPVVFGQNFDNVRATAGKLVVYLGRRGQVGLAPVGGDVQRVHCEHVAEVGVERLYQVQISKCCELGYVL